MSKQRESTRRISVARGNVLLALSAAIILISCSESDSDTSSTRWQAGTLFVEAIDWPGTVIDQFIAQINHTNEINDLIGECMQESGFEYVVQYTDTNEYIEEFGFGLSREQYASEFGFGISRGAVAAEEMSLSQRREQDQQRDYLGSLTPAEFDAYKIALEGDPSLESSEDGANGTNGCRAEAHSSLETPLWITHADWLMEVSDELFDTTESDQRLKRLDQQWSNCMSTMGHDDWSSELDLNDSLTDEFEDLVRLLTPKDPHSFGFLTALDDNSAADYRDYTAREIELATVSYRCVSEYVDEEYQILDELERAILESNPPPN